MFASLLFVNKPMGPILHMGSNYICSNYFWLLFYVHWQIFFSVCLSQEDPDNLEELPWQRRRAKKRALEESDEGDE